MTPQMPIVRRLTAPNAGPFTADGTNSWLVGRGDCIVIDPGPDDAGHLAAIMAAADGRIAAILLTHAHADHAAGAMRLAAMTGARVWGHPAMGGPWDAKGLMIDHPVADGQRLRFGEIELQAIHSPGHHPGHLILSLGDSAFSGDHIMGWASTSVALPDGDVAAYIASLDHLQGAAWRRLYPGHGADVTDPAARIATLLSHRRSRHAAIAAALTRAPQTAADLRPTIYPTLPEALARAATASLHAHLVALADEGRAQANGPATDPQTAFTAP